MDSAWAAGNHDEARRNSDIAKVLNIIGFVVGGIVWAIIIVGVITVVAVVGTTAASAAAAISGFNSQYWVQD